MSEQGDQRQEFELSEVIGTLVSTVQCLNVRAQKLECLAGIQQGAIEELGKRVAEHQDTFAAVNELTALYGSQIIGLYRSLGELAAALGGEENPSPELTRRVQSEVGELQRLFRLMAEEKPDGTV